MVVYLLKLDSLDCVAGRMVFVLSGNLEQMAFSSTFSSTSFVDLLCFFLSCVCYAFVPQGKINNLHTV